MQRLSQKSLGWDTELDKEDTTQWQAFRNDNQILATIKLAKCPLPPAEPTAIQLHIFSDSPTNGLETTVNQTLKENQDQ